MIVFCPLETRCVKGAETDFSSGSCTDPSGQTGTQGEMEDMFSLQGELASPSWPFCLFCFYYFVCGNQQGR